jgi:hypothetical protein
MLKSILSGILLLTSSLLSAQSTFNYIVELEPLNVPGLPGLHSYAFAQDNGKWLMIGGRLDGLHARQPFNAFPASQNNAELFVIDVNNTQFWTAPLSVLPVSIREQLQSTNMNFHQSGDTLYLIGGYAFSATANDHITFPNLTTIQVSSVIDAVVNGTSYTSYFKQITDNNFAVTGGQLGYLNGTFYLVGGQRFDGRYNPMGNPTFTQQYTDEIRKFTIDNSGAQLSYANYSTVNDPVHLHRRDYNLLPQIFPDGTPGFTISSGVFQQGVDLPFLYPVDITPNGYTPQTTFSQYLSNYHSAKACLYDSVENRMHNLFFGGISQYYYQNGNLIQDNEVPFVKTISRLTRSADSTLQEYQLPVEMPALKGAGAEFILNRNLPFYDNLEIIKLNQIQQDTVLIGHIYGGILSPSLNPFTNNQTNTTSADNSIYAVKLIRDTSTGSFLIDGANPYSISIYPNPADTHFFVEYELEKPVSVRYYVSGTNGELIGQGEVLKKQIGVNKLKLSIPAGTPRQTLFVTFEFDGRHYVNSKVAMGSQK